MEVATHETTAPTVAVVTAGGDATADGRGDGDGAGAIPTDPAEVLPEDGTAHACRDLADLEETLATASVDCVLVLSLPGTGSIDAVRDAVRARDPELPIVYAPAQPRPGAASALAGTSAAHYAPRSTGEGGGAAGGDNATPDTDTAERSEDPDVGASGLPELVADVVATYDRRRQDHREREMFREIMEMAPLAIYVKDEAGRHVAVSSVAEEAAEGTTLGKTDLELFAESDPDELDSEDYPPSYRDDRRVLEEGAEIEDAEERVELEGGEEIWLRTTKVPRRDDDGEVVGVLGVTRDVTPEKEREQELERETRRLEQFASFASHDLRNPVMVAQGNLELARSAEGDAAAEHLDTVEDALERMEALIDDLLEIASTESEQNEDWLRLAEVVERAWTAVEAPEADLRIDLPDDLELRAASGALRQLLENVLSNAVEHGGPDVSVTVGADETGFYVADDGPGIPAEDRETVFEYGYTTGGSGIGLAIAAEIAEAHGWEATAGESATGGARLAFDRCLLRRADAPAPVEGEAIALGEWRTVGDPDPPGGVEVSDGDGQAADAEMPGPVTIRAGGRALWGGIEEYGCYAADVGGGVRIEGRLTEVEPVHDYSKAGLLVADATEPGRPLGFVGKTARHGTEAAWRTASGEPVDTQQAEPDATLPRWYRIDRLGELVTFYGSADGEDWAMIDRRTLPCSEPVTVGLAVNSHEDGTTSEARFSAVRLVELENGQ